ncbi:MAG: hypothetical protein Q9227_002170 [Pyrenula ochraceoflavens]
MADTQTVCEEYNDPRRRPLLEQLKKNLWKSQELPLRGTLPPTVQACLWLADIDALQTIVDDSEEKRHSDRIVRSFRDIEDETQIIQDWSQRKRISVSRPPSIASSGSSASVSSLPAYNTTPTAGQKRTSSGKAANEPGRNRYRAEAARIRDKKQCVLTKAGEPNQMAHIFPYAMQGERITFWAALEMFWTAERIEKWKKSLKVNATEIVENLICLSPNAHMYWTKACFALKPLKISDDHKRLDIQFFWLPTNRYERAKAIMDQPALLASSTDRGPNSVKLFNNINERKLRTGDKITLETDDTDKYPLPSFELLEMQWFLHRVAAMSAAAEPRDDFNDDDDDNDRSRKIRVHSWLKKTCGGEADLEQTDHVSMGSSNYSSRLRGGDGRNISKKVKEEPEEGFEEEEKSEEEEE